MKQDAGELLPLGSEFQDVRLELEQIRAELQAFKWKPSGYGKP